MADEMSNQDGSREADEALEQLFDVEDMEGAQESGDEEVGLTSPDSTTDSTVVTKADNITNPNIHYGSEVAELKAVGGPSGPFDLPIEECRSRPGDGLVANDAGRAIRRRRIDAMSIDVRLGTRDEEGPGLVQHIKAGKVDVATIHDVDGSGFRQEHIEGMNVVQLAIRDVDKLRNVAPQVEQRVHLHRRLGGAEVRPRERPTGTERWSSSPGRRRYWSGPTPVLRRRTASSPG